MGVSIPSLGSTNLGAQMLSLGLPTREFLMLILLWY